MKNISIATLSVALVATAVSCMKEPMDSVSGNSERKTVVLQAMPEGNDIGTKTLRDESDGAVLWSPSDSISLFYGSGDNGGSKFVSQSTEQAAVTNFVGEINVITGGAEVSEDETYFWGLSPYDSDASCDGSYLTTTVKPSQTAVAGTFAPGTYITVGHEQGLIMAFYGVCGGIKFSVTKEGIRKVTLRGNNGEKIAGKVKVSVASDKTPSVEIVDGVEEVTLTAPAGKYLEPGANYYFVIIPTAFSAGFTMTFESYTEQGTYNRTMSTTIKRTIFAGLTNVDKNVTYEKKTGAIPIEDATFKAWLVSKFDTDGDGEISFDEAEKITSIESPDFSTESPSAQGIEYFTNLEALDVRGKGLKSLDASNNSALTRLNCRDNRLTSLDVSKNTVLTDLDCYNNQLTSLDVSKNTALTRLECYGNQLTALDVSNETNLTYLRCGENQLTSLDVSNNTALTSLDCYGAQLTSLDLSKNTALEYLSCGINRLTSLDLSNNTALTFLDCRDNQLSYLDLSNNIALNSYLICNDNQLTSLDVSNNTALNYLECSSNRLTSLDVSSNVALTELHCSGNQLTTLDVPNTTLTFLDCTDNQLTSLDVSSNVDLTDLRCGVNMLTTLDVSNNTALTSLSCGSNPLTSLDVSKNTALEHLDCPSSQLTSLDVSNNTALRHLSCYNNLLTSLYVSKNTSLTELYCSPMNDSDGKNLLLYLYISQGQSIPNVTSDRSTDCIPEDTFITTGPDVGGNEGTGDEPLDP